MQLNFRQNETNVSIRIGEKAIFSLNFSLMAANGFNLCAEGESGKLRLEGLSKDLPDGVQGYLIRSLPLQEKIKKLDFKNGWLCFGPKLYKRFYIDLSTSFSEYQKKFSPKTLSTIKRKIKSFKRFIGGELRWGSYRTSKEIKEFYQLARQVSIKTYQEKLLDIGLPDGEDFQQDMLERAHNNKVRAYLLFHGDTPISYLYCPIKEGVLLYEYLGYSPEYSKWSPGTILQWLALEEIFSEQKFRFFDFTEGETEHKKKFSTGFLECVDIYILSPRLLNFLKIATIFIFNIGISLVGSLLEKFNLKKAIRMILRGRAYYST